MQNFLISIGVFILLAFVSAFAVPYFVDWNGQRAIFEAQIRDILGQPAHIHGDISLRLLPVPLFKFNDIQLGSADKPVLTASSLESHIELLPLVTGKIVVRDVTLNTPKVMLSYGEKIGINLEGGIQNMEDGSRERISIEQLEIKDGLIQITNSDSGEVTQIENFHAIASLATLNGPISLEGAGSIHDELYEVRFSLGKLDTLQTRLKFRLLPAAQPLVIEGEGNLVSLDSHEIGFQGAVIAQIFDTLGRASENQDEPKPVFRIDSVVDAGLSRWGVTELLVTIPSEDLDIRFAGEASIVFAAQPELDIQLQGNHINWTAFKTRRMPTPVNFVLAELGKLESLSLWNWLGKIDLNLGSIETENGLAQDLRLKLEKTPQNWRIDTFSATLPGAKFDLSGHFVHGDAWGFIGDYRVGVASLQKAWRWVYGLDANIPFGNTPITASGNLSFNQEAFAVTQSTFDWNGIEFKGGLLYGIARGASLARIAVDLETQYLQVDGLLSQFQTDQNNSAPDFFKLFDLSLKFSASESIWAKQRIDNLDVDLSYNDGVLELRDFHLVSEDGSNVLVQGGLDITPSTPLGRLDYVVESGNFEFLSPLFSIFGHGELLERGKSFLSDHASTLLPVTLTGSMTLESDKFSISEDGTLPVILSTHGNGVLAGTDITWDIEAENILHGMSKATASGTLLLGNSRANALLNMLVFRQVFEPVAAWDNQPGEIVARFRGSFENGYALFLEGTTGVVRFDGEIGLLGQVDQFNLRYVQGSWQNMPLQVFPEQVANILTGSLEEDTINGVINVEQKGSDLEITELTLSNQNYTWRAQGKYHRGSGGDKLSLVASTYRLPFENLAGLIVKPIKPKEIKGEKALEFSQPLAMDVDLYISAGNSSFGDLFQLRNSDFRLEYQKSGKLVIQGSGSYLDGAFSLDATVLKADLGVDLTIGIDLSQINAADFLWKYQGHAVAEGRLSTKLNLQSKGDSAAALLTALQGTGEIEIKSGTLRRFSPHSFEGVLRSADVGQTLSTNEIERTVLQKLLSESMEFDAINGTVTVQNGIFRSANVNFSGIPYEISLSGSYDILSNTLLSEWLVKAIPEAKTDAQAQFSLLFTGDLGDPDMSIDTSSLAAYLNVRMFEQNIKRLEELKIGEELERASPIQPESAPLINAETNVERPANDKPAVQVEIPADPNNVEQTQNAPNAGSQNLDAANDNVPSPSVDSEELYPSKDPAFLNIVDKALEPGEEAPSATQNELPSVNP